MKLKAFVSKSKRMGVRFEKQTDASAVSKKLLRFRVSHDGYMNYSVRKPSRKSILQDQTNESILNFQSENALRFTVPDLNLFKQRFSPDRLFLPGVLCVIILYGNLVTIQIIQVRNRSCLLKAVACQFVPKWNTGESRLDNVNLTTQIFLVTARPH